MKTLKKTLCVILSLAMVLGMVATASASSTKFADETITYGEAVDVMTFTGVISGFPDGTFKPTETLTRAQAAKIITLMLGYGDVSVEYTGEFNDIADCWAKENIGVAAGLGIVSGMGNGKFAPDSKLTGFQWAKMLLCAMGYKEDAEGLVGSGWEANVARLIAATEMTKNMDDFSGKKAVAREEACQMAFNVLFKDFVSTKAERETAARSVATGAATLVNTLSAKKNFAEVLKLTKSATAVDAFGRPTATYVLNAGKINEDELTVATAAKLSYNTAKYYKDLYKDLGIAFNADYPSKLTVIEDGLAGVATDFYTLSTGTSKLGGQGSLMEVFATKQTDGHYDYTAAILNTYVGQLTAWKAATKDANGNVVAKAKCEITSVGATKDADNAKMEALVLDASDFTAADVANKTIVTYNLAYDATTKTYAVKNLKAAKSANVAPVAYSVSEDAGKAYIKTADDPTTKIMFSKNINDAGFVKEAASKQVGNALLPKIELLSELFGKLNLKDDLVKVYYDDFGNIIYVKDYTTANAVANVFVLKDAKAVGTDKDYSVELTLVDTTGNVVTKNATATGGKFVSETEAKAAALALKATHLNGLIEVEQFKAADQYMTYKFTVVGQLARVASLKSNAVNLIKGLTLNGNVTVSTTLRGILESGKLNIADYTTGKDGTFAINTLLTNIGANTAVEAWISAINAGPATDIIKKALTDLKSYTAVAPHVDDTTIFMVENGEGYDIYNGVRNLPALAAKNLLGIGGEFVTYGLKEGTAKEVVLLKNAVATEAPAKKDVNVDDYIYVLSNGFGVKEVGYDYVSYPVIKGGELIDLPVSNLLPLVNNTMVIAKDYEVGTGKLTAVWPTLDGHVLYTMLQPIAKSSTDTKDTKVYPAILNGVLYCEGLNFLVAEDYKVVKEDGTTTTIESLPAKTMVWLILDGNDEVKYIIVPDAEELRGVNDYTASVKIGGETPDWSVTNFTWEEAAKGLTVEVTAKNKKTNVVTPGAVTNVAVKVGGTDISSTTIKTDDFVANEKTKVIVSYKLDGEDCSTSFYIQVAAPLFTYRGATDNAAVITARKFLETAVAGLYADNDSNVTEDCSSVLCIALGKKVKSATLEIRNADERGYVLLTEKLTNSYGCFVNTSPLNMQFTGTNGKALTGDLYCVVKDYAGNVLVSQGFNILEAEPGTITLK